jgi:uncharacterized protein
MGCLRQPGGGAARADPFTTHRFLWALERSGSVGPGSGWEPQHMLVHQAGQLVAAAPMYMKSHSQGEYLSTMLSRRAMRGRAGGITPSCKWPCPSPLPQGGGSCAARGLNRRGRRPSCKPWRRLRANMACLRRMSPFAHEAEAELGPDHGYLPRVTEQFHWENPGYAGFDGFLAALSSRKRKTIRKERATAQGFGGEIRQLTGDALQPQHWDAFWQFYQDTGARKWGTPYLTRAFFDIVQESMRDDVLLVLAEREGQPVAGALNFIAQDTLYGRYWGCTEDHPCLHFELCYYQAMDYAIDHGLARVEAGAQGTHKLARGYLPARVHSLHYFPEAAFHRAVAQYLTEEGRAIDYEMRALADYAPFRKGEKNGRETD